MKKEYQLGDIIYIIVSYVSEIRNLPVPSRTFGLGAFDITRVKKVIGSFKYGAIWTNN